MQVELKWNGMMGFEATARNQTVLMDAKAPIGKGAAQTPKELVIAGLCGCTAMDVIAMMRKHKQDVESFKITAEVTVDEKSHPHVFAAVKMNFWLTGTIDAGKAIEAVRRSQSEYCGVSAMLVKAFPITWEVFIQGVSVGSGKTAFKNELSASKD